MKVSIGNDREVIVYWQGGVCPGTPEVTTCILHDPNKKLTAVSHVTKFHADKYSVWEAKKQSLLRLFEEYAFDKELKKAVLTQFFSTQNLQQNESPSIAPGIGPYLSFINLFDKFLTGTR